MSSLTRIVIITRVCVSPVYNAEIIPVIWLNLMSIGMILSDCIMFWMEYPADSICGAFSMNFHIRHTTPSAMKGNFFVSLFIQRHSFTVFPHRLLALLWFKRCFWQAWQYAGYPGSKEIRYSLPIDKKFDPGSIKGVAFLGRPVRWAAWYRLPCDLCSGPKGYWSLASFKGPSRFRTSGEILHHEQHKELRDRNRETHGPRILISANVW